MNFRFPHPFENIGDAIKDALDPETPADGSLVIQLMNENNRAIEDAIVPVQAYSSFQAVCTITQTSGVLALAWSSLSDVSTSGSGLTQGIVPTKTGVYNAASSWTITGTAGDSFEVSFGSVSPNPWYDQIVLAASGTSHGSAGGPVVTGPAIPMRASISSTTSADWTAVARITGYIVKAV